MRIVVFLGLFPATIHAGEFDKQKFDNWHQWRGPLATGEAPKADPPINWDAKSNIKWKVEIPGRGSATPIIWEDRVFVLTSVETDKKVEPDNRPKVDPKFEKKTDPPEHYYQFLVFCF